MQTQYSGIAEPVGMSHIGVPVCGHAALAYAYQSVADAACPYVAVMVCVDALYGMGGEG